MRGDERIRRELERLLGERVQEIQPLSGGDVGRAFRVRVGTGARSETLFAKTYAAAAAGAADAMVAAEARGLSWLAEAQAVRVPAVRASTAAGAGEPAWLVLEWIEPGRPSARSDEEFGRNLAALHGFGAACFGFESDGFAGSLAWSNAASPTWATFYSEERLAPLLAGARAKGLLAPRVAELGERVLARLPELVGPPEPPARLHGDLWGGNRLHAAGGESVLIDPAAYGGHREIDLAMMRLFGGFSERVFEAYREAAPLAEGCEERVALYQLLPLLVHLHLFGGAYARQVEDTLRVCLSRSRSS